MKTKHINYCDLEGKSKQNKCQVRYPHYLNFLGWFGCFKKYDCSEVVLPCSSRSVFPAMAAKLAGKKTVVLVSTNFEISHVSKLLLQVADEVRTYSASLEDACRSRKAANNKIVDVSGAVQSEFQQGISLVYSENKSVLAICGENNINGLFDIFRICALVYRVIPDMKLGIITHLEAVKKQVSQWQADYGTPDMCFFIEKITNSTDNECCIHAALSGPGVVDSPVLFDLARKANVNVIADKRSASDFPGSEDSFWVDGTRIRQYASALLKILK